MSTPVLWFEMVGSVLSPGGCPRCGSMECRRAFADGLEVLGGRREGIISGWGCVPCGTRWTPTRVAHLLGRNLAHR